MSLYAFSLFIAFPPLELHRLQQFPETNHICQLNSLLPLTMKYLIKIDHTCKDLILANALLCQSEVVKIKMIYWHMFIIGCLVSAVSEWKSSGFGPLLMHYS